LSNFQPTGLPPDTDKKIQGESVDRYGAADTPFVVEALLNSFVNKVVNFDSPP